MATVSEMSETEVKVTIKSLLTSTPHVSTIQSIQRDYQDLIGQAIPFLRFKYNSLEHFLKSIPDVCKVNGSGSFASVYPIISDKIAHIDQMVTKQKVNVKSRQKYLNPRRPRTSFPSTNISSSKRDVRYSITPNNSSHSVSCDNFNRSFYSNDSKVTSLPNKELCNIVSSQATHTYTTNISTSANNLVNNRASEQNVQFKNTCKSSERANYDKIIKQGNKLEGQLVKDKLGNFSRGQGKPSVTSIAPLSRSNVEKWNNSSNKEIPDNAPIRKCQNMDNDRCRQCNDFSPYKDDYFGKSEETLINFLSFESAKEMVEEDTSNVPKRVQSNLKALISQFNEGLWLCDLPEHYRKLFRKELLFMDYGYTSLIDMCIALKDIFHYVRPGKDDFKLYDRHKPLPPNVAKIYTIASYDVGERISHNEALPKLDWSDFKGHIPEDAFRNGNEIPNQFLPEGSKTENVLDVVVVEIYDPSKFWFYLGTSDSPAVLDTLMDEIQNFYNQPENAKDYGIPPRALKEGLYCVQIIYGEYHRAKIVHVLPDSDDYVRVLYIDYGTVCKVPVKGMCFLRSTFAAVPAQAIRCRLANIVPQLKGHPWPQSASSRFRELVNRRDTKIKISYIDWTEEFVCVFLADVTDSKNILYLNEVLVKEGHARWDGETQHSPLVMSNFKCKVQNVHLFPTFLELEYGLAPSANEMYSLSEMLVPLQFCISQYFEPNDQVLNDGESDLEELQNSFIDTVKNHRKFTPLSKVDVNMIVNNPPIDFDVFGDLQAEIIQFCHRMNLVENKEVLEENARQEQALFSDIENESLHNQNEKNYITRGAKGYESLQLLNQDWELSESIIRLEKYSILDSEPSVTSDSKSDDQSDLLDSLIQPQESNVAKLLEVYEEHLPNENIVEHNLFTVQEQSESSVDSTNKLFPVFCPNNNDVKSDLNIFDNPEAFEDKSESSGHSDEPVTSQSFFKTIESKYFHNEDLEEGSDGLASTSVEAHSSITNLGTGNPFKFETDHPGLQLFNGSCTTDGLTESISEDKILQEASTEVLHSSLDLPFKSSLDDTKGNLTGSLNLTNPFRTFLDDCDDYKSFTDTVSSDMLTAESNKTVNTDSQTENMSLSEVDEQLLSDSDGSDYKVFAPKENRNAVTNVSNAQDSLCCTTVLSATAETHPPNISRVASVNIQTNMSLRAAEFVPASYHSQHYAPWLDGGGYRIPQHPQWSNGTTCPMVYPPYPIRGHPPGFTRPLYQGPPYIHQTNEYMMPPVGPPMYPQYPPLPQYYGAARHSDPYLPVTNILELEENDIYEKFNEQLLKKDSSGKS